MKKLDSKIPDKQKKSKNKLQELGMQKTVHTVLRKSNILKMLSTFRKKSKEEGREQRTMLFCYYVSYEELLKGQLISKANFEVFI